MHADYKGGVNMFNNTSVFLCAQTATCFATPNPNAPLGIRRAGRGEPGAARRRCARTAGYSENPKFWRLREVSATYTLPDVVSQATALAARERRSRCAQPARLDEVHG